MGVDFILDRLEVPGGTTEAELDRVVAELIERHPAEVLRQAVRRRLSDLSGPGGYLVLRIVEATQTPALLDELADALLGQEALAPDRAWDALSLLRGGTHLSARPELADRLRELDEAFEDEDQVLDEFIEQIEGDPEGPWLAWQGLEAIEPELRAEILEGLQGRADGPRLREFLELARRGALEPGAEERALVVSRPAPRLVGSLVTAVDGQGRARIALLAEDRGDWLEAVFTCDVLHGVVDVVGRAHGSRADLFAARDEIATSPDCDVIEDVPDLALGLLRGCLALNRPGVPRAVDEWLDRTMGPDHRPHLWPELALMDETGAFTTEEVAEHVAAVFDASATWLDVSPLTHELAQELRLRGETDILADSGLYRFLFERRLQRRVELDRRMLSWMAAFWSASGAVELSWSARVLAGQLGDAQNVVPSHPYFVGLARRSIEYSLSRTGSQ